MSFYILAPSSKCRKDAQQSVRAGIKLESRYEGSDKNGCKPFIPSRHIHSIIKHLVYYTTLGIVKINIFEHFKKYLNSTNIFLETDNNFTQ